MPKIALLPLLRWSHWFLRRTAAAGVAACWLVGAPVYASAELAKAKNCMGCHALNAKVVGPAFQAVAKKYQGNAAAADQLALKIRQGGGGVWGVIKMPANPQVDAVQAKQLAAWVLSQ